MSIRFCMENDGLILYYSPDIGGEEIAEKLMNNETISIKRTFFVSKENQINPLEDLFDYDGTFCFRIGCVIDDSIHIDSTIVRTKHKFSFSKSVKLEQKLFVAYNGISILRKIDKIIGRDFYVGERWEEKKGVPIEEYKNLIGKFPNSTELAKYSEARISRILEDYFPECDKYEEIYQSFLERKKTYQQNSPIAEINCKTEYEQFSLTLSRLEHMLASSNSYCEKKWQEEIKDIIQLLYPKYIYVTREVEIPGVDDFDKKLDFLMVDANGYIDILEIKKPEARILSEKPSYRNNYVPVRDLVGSIQQVEKYIHCMVSMHDKKDRNVFFRQFNGVLPDSVTPEIVNPQGMILLGRSRDFNGQQRRDFELVRRQYKNIVDIITYDDLINRLHTIVNALGLRINSEKT